MERNQEANAPWASPLSAYDHLADEDLLFRYQQRGDLGAIYCLFDRYAHLAYGCFALQGLDGPQCLEKVEALFMQLIRGDREIMEQGFRPWIYAQCEVREGVLSAPSLKISPEKQQQGWQRFSQGKAGFAVLAREWGLEWEDIAPLLRPWSRS